MSTNNNIPLNRITVPAITDANYASGLDDALQHINDNFSILSNRDFVKGENGASIEILEDKFFNENGQITILGSKLKSCIEAHTQNEQERANITYGDITLTLWDNFTPETAGSLYMIYKTENNDVLPEPISSLYYVFLDGRYANNKVGLIDPAVYTNTRDLSCILVYDAGEFKILDNAFPTIYYERGVGLCWKINGNGTGLPVQGVPGKDGLNATINIVKCNNVAHNTAVVSGVVDSVFSIYDGYVPVATVDNIDNFNGAAALILIPETSVGADGTVTTLNSEKFYFGYTNIVETEGENGIVKTLYAYCDSETPISYGVKINEILNAMKNIKLVGASQDTSAGLKGIFIPITNVDATGKQPVHLLSATAITNTEGNTNSDNTDVIFTPVNDINNLNVTDSENSSLKVDKYLYLQVDNTSNIFANHNTKGTNAVLPLSKLETCNYTLKYKLAKNVVNVNNIGLNAMYFGYSPNLEDLGVSSQRLTTSNTVYYATVFSEYGMSATTFSNKSEYTLPKTFADRLTGFTEPSIGTSTPLGIYRWELCETRHSFDVDNLNAINGEAETYDFPEAFNVIYTTTVNPSISSDYLWFNGMEIIPNDYYNINDSYNSEGYITSGSNIGKFVIPGWNNGGHNIFKFIKFVPVYDNDFATQEDTALNLNYNVNVTGDANNPNRNITIHGSVNCDDLSVYRLTATGEIKNIFTQDDIVSTRGIKLAYGPLGSDTDTSNYDYKFKVDNNGAVTADKLTADKIESTYTNVDTISARQSHSNEIFINDTNSKRQMFAGNIGVDGTTYKFGIETTNTQSITLNRHENDSTRLGIANLQPMLSTDIPILGNNKANLTVSNQYKGSEDLCYYGAPAKSSEFGSGVVETTGKVKNNYITTPTFEVVKNFNINRLSGGIQSNKNISAVKVYGSYTSKYKNNVTSIRNDNMKIASVASDAEKEYSLATGSMNTNDIYKNLAIQQFTIKKSETQTSASGSESFTFDRTEPIRIEFLPGVDYVLPIGIKGKNSNGRWPVLKNSSTMELELWCEIETVGSTTTTDMFKLMSHKPGTLSFSTNDPVNNSGFEWRGYDENGKYLNKDYEFAWRYYEYKFRPEAFVIASDQSVDSNYIKIANAYDAGKTIKFYVFPKFNIYAMGQTMMGIKKKVVSGLIVHTAVPIEANNDITKASKDVINCDGPDGGTTAAWKYTAIKEAASLSYKEVKTSNGNSDINITTVCEDGIVIRSGMHTFGLGNASYVFDHKNNGYVLSVDAIDDKGYWELNKTNVNRSEQDHFISNVPSLFYYKTYNSNKMKETEKTSYDYARRVNAIPLEDIFNAIKHIRQTKNEWSEFGL